MERQDHPTGTVPPGEQPYPAQQPWVATPPPYGPEHGTQPAAEPERPKWSTRRTGAVTAVAAAAVLAIGGVAVAHGGDSGSTGTTQDGGPGGAGRGAFPGAGTQAGLAGALHGTFVTESGGTYVTQLLQTGTVSAVSATSISVRSADDYAKTYTISSATTVNGGQSTVGAIQTGHTVTVIASEAGAAATVLDQSLTAGQGGPGGFPGGAPGGTTGQDGTTGQGTTT
ncbi:MAG TPA: hypothetical protein VI357_03165 [Mycobacteriales bacterium]